MGMLHNLFARSAGIPVAEEPVRREWHPKGGEEAPGGHGIEDSAAFEFLAKSQQSVDHYMWSVGQGLATVQQLSDQMRSLKGEMASTFDEHRRLAAANVALRQGLDHAQGKLSEKTAENDDLHREIVANRSKLKETSEALEKARAELEAIEHRHHLLGISKKEVDELLSRTSSQLAIAQDEAEGLRLECGALKLRVEADSNRIAELSASYNEAHEKSVLLTKRCETNEASLQLKGEEITELKQSAESLTHENSRVLQFANQKGLEADQTRSEMSKLFEKYQSDTKSKEADLNLVRFEADSLRSSVRMLEQINSDLKIENEKVMTDVRHLQEATKQFEVTVARLEGKLARTGGNLDATLTAKSQIEQSREAMAARLDATTQALRGREVDVKRLENEVAAQASQIEEQSALYHDTLEALNARVFELEKELASQLNEVRFYATQAETNKRVEAR